MKVSFEDFTKMKIKVDNEQRKFVKYKNEIIDLLDEWILSNEDIRKKYDIEDYMNGVGFDISRNKLVITFVFDEGIRAKFKGSNVNFSTDSRTITIDNEDFAEFKNFMANPDTYKDAKKYNL